MVKDEFFSHQSAQADKVLCSNSESASGRASRKLNKLFILRKSAEGLCQNCHPFFTVPMTLYYRTKYLLGALRLALNLLPRKYLTINGVLQPIQLLRSKFEIKTATQMSATSEILTKLHPRLFTASHYRRKCAKVSLAVKMI